MHTCPHCKQSLGANHFYRNAARRNGLSILCKPCHKAYEATPHRKANNTWHTINARVRRQQSYEHVTVNMTQDAFLGWAVPAYSLWMALHPQQTPSLDRVDPDGNYELGNLQILERGENSRRARNHPNVYAPTGTAWCQRCATYLPKSSFWSNAGQYNKLQARCKTCQTEAIRESAARSSRNSSA